MIGLAWKHPNVYIDTSAYLPRYYPPQLLHFVETYGRDKVLFGTNWPQLDFGRAVAQAKNLALSGEAMAALLHANAHRVFALRDRGRVASKRVEQGVSL
jgi:predicted TIM-barrel fold metal-dependent hydrolase